MSNEERFDVIVVGAGLAGNTAAYLMAKAGLEVICKQARQSPRVAA